MTDIKEQIKEFRIGQKIRGLRQQKRLTLQELSDLTTLSKPLLSQIENEQVVPPWQRCSRSPKDSRSASISSSRTRATARNTS
ncbi:helix-turn-helix domain-containing protein [Geobacter sp. FeAm09]|uniref:helix-turn-helix domain-containing protein n=1 Tax=Geobacter sp. FeAm09 TaxID=2597769 RepID=UPI00351B7446